MGMGFVALAEPDARAVFGALAAAENVAWLMVVPKVILVMTSSQCRRAGVTPFGRDGMVKFVSRPAKQAISCFT